MKTILVSLLVVCMVSGISIFGVEEAAQQVEFKGSKFRVVSIERKPEYNMTPGQSNPLIIAPNNPGEEFLIIHMEVELIPPTKEVEIERKDVSLTDSSGNSYEFFPLSAKFMSNSKDFPFPFSVPLGISLGTLKIGEMTIDLSEIEF